MEVEGGCGWWKKVGRKGGSTGEVCEGGKFIHIRFTSNIEGKTNIGVEVLNADDIITMECKGGKSVCKFV